WFRTSCLLHWRPQGPNPREEYAQTGSGCIAPGRPARGVRDHRYLSESAAVGKTRSGIAVVVEVAPKRSFASALDWPGWCRSGRTPGEALEAVAAYADRYAAVASTAGLRLPAIRGVE